MELKKILLVDDEEDIIEFLSYNLRKRGYEVYAAQNGLAALTVVEGWLPDLIVADIMMPEKNGISMCYDLKKNIRTKNIPVIFLSASSDDYHALAAMDAGGAHYISKPARIETLCAIIQEELFTKKQAG